MRKAKLHFKVFCLHFPLKIKEKTLTLLYKENQHQFTLFEFQRQAIAA